MYLCHVERSRDISKIFPSRRKRFDSLTSHSLSLRPSRVWRRYFALVYLGLADHARALDYLEQAQAADSQWMMYLKIDRIFDPLRADRRFIALMKKCHFEK
jgi:hypothetical protein